MAQGYRPHARPRPIDNGRSDNPLTGFGWVIVVVLVMAACFAMAAAQQGLLVH